MEMSRAFVKEMDDVLPAEPAAYRPLSRPMTRRGLAEFERRLAEAAEGTADRRSLDAIVAAAVVVDPPEDRDCVAFGARVGVTGAGSGQRTFTIVGEDEIDVESARIGVSSPLAEALLGARVGDIVVWQRPAGPAELKVVDIAYDDA
jgi:transcription elongation factor GreB